MMVMLKEESAAPESGTKERIKMIDQIFRSSQDCKSNSEVWEGKQSATGLLGPCCGTLESENDRRGTESKSGRMVPGEE